MKTFCIVAFCAVLAVANAGYPAVAPYSQPAGYAAQVQPELVVSYLKPAGYARPSYAAPLPSYGAPAPVYGSSNNEVVGLANLALSLPNPHGIISEPLPNSYARIASPSYHVPSYARPSYAPAPAYIAAPSYAPSPVQAASAAAASSAVRGSRPSIY